MSDEASAILEWINTFNLKPARPRNIADVTDGFIFAKILFHIDPQFFPEPTTASPSSSWVLRFNTLKRLHKQLQKYYTDILLLPPPKISPNISAIAKDSSEEETIKFCRLLVLAAVQSDRREIYIGKIRNLGRSAQTDLMHAIEKATADSKSQSSSQTPSPTPFHLEEQMASILKEKESLLRVNNDLTSQLVQARSDYEQLQKENESLSKHVLDSEVATKSFLDKADQHLRSEIESARAEVTALEAKLAERDITIHEQSGQISQLGRKVQELSPLLDENRHFRDQIEELFPLVEKCHKLENVVEKYRKKIEESSDLVKQLQQAEERSLSLSAELQKSKDQLSRSEANAQLVESYKREIQSYQDMHSTLTREKVALNHQLEVFVKEQKEYEMEKLRDAQQIQLLQDRVKEIETKTPNDNLQTEINGESITEIKLKMNQMQRELDAVHHSDDSSSEFLILKALYADALCAKEKFEKEIIELHQEKLCLQRQCENLSSSPEKSKFVSQLRERCRLAEAHVVEERKKLAEYKLLSLTKEFTGDDRFNQLEKERSQHLDRLLAEKKEFQSELVVKGSTKREDSNDDTETSTKTGDQDRVAELVSQLDEMKRKMARAKEFIKKQDTVLKEKDKILKNATSTTSTESQIAILKQTHQETVCALRQELRLMSSAWYNLCNRVQHDNVVVKRAAATPTSWLSSQRRNVDVGINQQTP